MGQGIYFKVKQASVSSPNYEKVLSFEIPAPSPIRIIDISLNPDAVFSSTGIFGLTIGGQTNETDGSPLPTALDIPVWAFEDKGLVLNPGDTVDVFASNSSGTGKITAVITGEIL
ncbi:hypothetical protein KAS08_02485 [Candidatus Pacearchaeota archaeon]|nr:hypothetical protein [Candidatus Pacearchaeota archaeon]